MLAPDLRRYIFFHLNLIYPCISRENAINAQQDKLQPEAKFASSGTRENPEDQRWKVADNLEKDNEEKLREQTVPKKDQAGG